MQFATKVLMTLGLGVLLGGVMPMLLEAVGLALGSRNPMFMDEHHKQLLDRSDCCLFLCGTMGFSAWLALVGLFASSLARSFLQAIGIALVTFVGLMMCAPVFTSEQMSSLASIAPHSFLPLIVAVPTLIVTLTWLAYLNFKNFRDGLPLWWRNLLVAVAAFVFIVAGSSAIYHRAWEIFEPAEPAHGAARLSLANPPELRNETYQNLLVRLPDGRVWFDYLSDRIPHAGPEIWRFLWRIMNPLPRSAGPRKFIAGSNWADASARHVEEQVEASAQGSRDTVYITGYADSIGIQADGTLWASDKSHPKIWTADRLSRFGTETNWQQFVRRFDVTSVLLLKKDGTLWRWGTNHFDFHGWPQAWPGLRAFQPYRIGADSDWTGIYSLNGFLARKADGSVRRVLGRSKAGQDQLVRTTNYDEIVAGNVSLGGWGDWGAYIRNDGSLWLFGQLHRYDRSPPEFETLRSGQATNWVSVARNWNWMVAIQRDGTLWQWPAYGQQTLAAAFTASPTRLGIHHDWISVVGVQDGVVSLAADGSLWLWPNPSNYQYSESLLRLPKQPQFIGNVFSAAE